MNDDAKFKPKTICDHCGREGAYQIGKSSFICDGCYVDLAERDATDAAQALDEISDQ